MDIPQASPPSRPPVVTDANGGHPSNHRARRTTGVFEVGDEVYWGGAMSRLYFIQSIDLELGVAWCKPTCGCGGGSSFALADLHHA